MESGAVDGDDRPAMTLAMARRYFVVQAAAGALWWLVVFASDDVRRLTLGGWEPRVLVLPDTVFFVVASAWAAASGSRWVGLVVSVWTVSVTASLAAYALVEQEAGWGVVAMTLASIATVAATLTLWSGKLPTEWLFRGPFAFRPARPASGSGHLVRSLAQLVVFWSAFFIAVPPVVAYIEHRLAVSAPLLRGGVRSLVGWVLFAAGSAVGVWSCVTMAIVGQGTPLPAQTASQLVVAGPYHYVRNPMAVAGAVQTAAIGLVIGSWIVITLAVAGAIVWDAIIRPVEEADLAARFGAPYEDYRRSVRCWIPRRAL